MAKIKEGKKREIVVGLVGNPNSGKTTIFNALTGSRHRVANWSGVTVEKKEGLLKRGGIRFRIIDLPGIYSLTSYSIEELITRKFILEEEPDLVVNVVDAGNLSRNLYLTTQLIDLGARVVLVLNMSDEAEAKGLYIDSDGLGSLLGMPVVRTVGKKSEGVEDLIDVLLSQTAEPSGGTRRIKLPYGRDIEDAISVLESALSRNGGISGVPARWMSIMLLENDADAANRLSLRPDKSEILRLSSSFRISLQKRFKDDIQTLFGDMRYGFISGAVRECAEQRNIRRSDISERIDVLITHRYLGFPILFLFLWALFQAAFSLGRYPMELIQHLMNHLGGWIGGGMPDGPLKRLVTEGIIGGVGGVAVFLPNILILFLGISFMEDTGYMARAAFIMDKIMHRIGLHGKSFIPLIMGFGCNVPAIMAARTLENRQDRILTILINPFMSCSARLPVYILFCGIFFHKYEGAVILSLYSLGIFLALASGRLFKFFFFEKESAPFVMELPPYRMPTVKTTLLHMWDRASQYMKKMAGVILVFSVIIWILGEYPKSPEAAAKYDRKYADLKASYDGVGDPEKKYAGEIKRLKLERRVEEKRQSAIGMLGNAVHPLIEPLGFNWQMGISLLTGFVAKEIVVSTMGVLYHAESDDRKAMASSISEELKKAEHAISPLSAYAFMVFVLLYVPCIATIVAIGREAGPSWAVFSIFYQLTVAWLVSFLVFKIGGLII